MEAAHDPDGPTEEIELESVDLSIASIPTLSEPDEATRRKSSTPPPLPAEALRLRQTPIPHAADLKARLKPPTPLAQRATPVPAAGTRPLRTAALSGEQFETLQAEIERLTKRLSERDAYLGELEVVYAQRAEALLAAEKQLEALQSELEARNARIAQLEAALAARSSLSKNGTAPDDLTRIRGIGPRYARQLQELGVRTFATIAAWTADECAHFARQLKVNPGRVERDRWVEQARALSDEAPSPKSNEPDL